MLRAFKTCSAKTLDAAWAMTSGVSDAKTELVISSPGTFVLRTLIKTYKDGF
jgi:hypothetical protein